jgi:LuxR family transcriptional regulator, quorum-sensing system regulator SolR
MNQERCAERWWLDVLETTEQSRGPTDLFERVRQIGAALGFSYCCYGIRIPLSHDRPSVRIFDSYPTGWMEHYVERGYMGIDPTVQNGLQSSAPLVWSDRTFAAAPNLWADAREHGLRVGVAQSSWCAPGVFALLSFARSHDDLTQAEFNALKPKLQWLAHCSQQRMQSFLTIPEAEPSARLSTRERDVLSWTADGKTAWETSQILGISESTVAFHMKNAMSKLNCQTKVQAVAKAIALGLLFGRDIERCGSTAPGLADLTLA